MSRLDWEENLHNNLLNSSKEQRQAMQETKWTSEMTLHTTRLNSKRLTSTKSTINFLRRKNKPTLKKYFLIINIQIRLHEQVEFRQMNEKERIRFRVRELYDNDAAQLKINQTKSFEDLLDDQIDQRNVHHEDIQKQKEKLEKLYSDEGIRKQKFIVYTLAIIGALIFYPLFFSFWTKYRLEQ